MKFGMVTQVGHERVSKGVTPLYVVGGAPASTKFWNPYVRQNGLTLNDKNWYDSTGHRCPSLNGQGKQPNFCMVITLECEETFHTVDNER